MLIFMFLFSFVLMCLGLFVFGCLVCCVLWCLVDIVCCAVCCIWLVVALCCLVCYLPLLLVVGLLFGLRDWFGYGCYLLLQVWVVGAVALRVFARMLGLPFVISFGVFGCVRWADSCF